MFKVTENNFDTEPHIVAPISLDYLFSKSMQYFDKEGYELNELEQEYYQINQVELNRILNHVCCQKEWITSNPEPKQGPYFDHCMILTRWDYQEVAREQLIEAARIRPSLNKLLKIKPKWGIDLSLEYQWEDGNITEIFHIEVDKHSLNAIIALKEQVESIIFSKDWHDVAVTMEKYRDNWVHLNSDDQSDWRCRFLGLPRAYDNLKIL